MCISISSGEKNGRTLLKLGWVGTTFLVSGASSLGYPDGPQGEGAPDKPHSTLNQGSSYQSGFTSALFL